MVYFVNAWIEDGTVKCASQICENCSKREEYNCKPMVLLSRDWKQQLRLEQLREGK